VVIVDNCKTHTSSWSGHVVEELLVSHGVLYVCLPAYSPELNPCEFVFAQVKRIANSFGGDMDVLLGMLSALKKVNVPQMIQYYKKCRVPL